MQLSKQAIPIHRMRVDKPLEIVFNNVKIDGWSDISKTTHKNEVHRDDYYLFLFTDSVNSVYVVDFEEIQVGGSSMIYYVRPGQVHFVSSIHNTRGWVLTVDPMFVEQDYRNIFERQFLTQKPIISLYSLFH
ncbi:MAG: hypothetical protein PHG27_04115 [Massilibacteroides sp.]|nr:hypothetical protein [Massilibacteroides sp.]